MPLVYTSDWEDGPQGPGFFLMFPKLTATFWDGGPLDALIGRQPLSDHKKKQLEEIVAVLLMMRCRC